MKELEGEGEWRRREGRKGEERGGREGEERGGRVGEE